ncbi:MAG: hypothetical protein WCE62_21485 [Polyangiales bacterium]
MTWKTVGGSPPAALSRARLQLHWAAQLVSAPGTSMLPPSADFAHTNLGWEPKLGVLAGRNVGAEGLRAALVFESLELAAVDGIRERASMRLSGRTMQDALGWLGRELGADRSKLAVPAHELPSHPVGAGGVFSDAGPAARSELAVWFANAFALIRDIVTDERSASPVRCWPHHFDVASLIKLDSGASGTEARSIGIGFSPGDGSYDQPYFYVTPWPYPQGADLPPLSGGAQWHLGGWTGVVLTAERVLAAPRREQVRTVRIALEQGLAACRELLGS